MVQDDSNLLDPLNAFYAEAGLPLPVAGRLDGKTVPEPYKSLLVHQNDMTPTLESFYNQKIHLRVLKAHFDGEVYSRQVVLVLDADEKPVAFGAIRIHLEHLPLKARELILEEKRPLGAILYNQGVDHASRPNAFFQVGSDAFINSVLGLKSSNLLYGRRNILSNSSQRILAEIIEILPPSQSLPSMEKSQDQR